MPSSFIKDSANNYELYVDRNSTYTITLNAIDFGFSDITNVSFHGSIKRHFSTPSFVNFTITKDVINNQFTLTLTPSNTNQLTYPIYVFDVYSIFETIHKKVISGIVVMSGGVTEITEV